MPTKWQWKTFGPIIQPDPNIYWMCTYAGPSFARPVGDSTIVDIFVTGRDVRNRSQIGCVRLDIKNPKKIISISPDPIFSFGDLGAFDENGVSYPFIVEFKDQTFMYYVGWMPTVMTPFQNHIGLAIEQGDGSFKRISRAPILERTNADFSSMGSSCVLVDGDKLRLWYSSFLKWGRQGEHKHYYVIKYAESIDGIHWKRDDDVCIDIMYDWEFSICRPSVIKDKSGYHMWYCTRGQHYRIGYAHSQDGIHWTRQDDRAGIAKSGFSFDSLAQSYPYVFRVQDQIYMIYNGNDYGKEGLGLAVVGNI